MPHDTPLTWRALLERLLRDVEARSATSPPDPRDVGAHGMPTADHDAWREAAGRVGALAEALVARLSVRDVLEAEDLSQEVLLRLQSPATLRRLTQLASPVGYLVVILQNAARDRLRRVRSLDRIRREIVEEALGDNLPSVEDTEASLAVVEVFARLDPADQELVRMRFWEDLPLQAIADALDVSYSAVAVRLSRLIRRLQKELQDKGL